jgi:formate dehydrogenase
MKTFCRICEAHCGLVVDVTPEGGIAGLRPDKNHPISQGFVCAKGLRFLDVADHPDRVLFPLIRNADGNLERASQDQALQTISGRLRPILDHYGPHSVAIYFGTPFIHNALGMVALSRLITALGTRNVYSAGSQDNNNKWVSQRIVHGSEYMQPIMDVSHADLALMLGVNPALSQGTFMHYQGGTRTYDDFIKRGGKMIIVDPRESESAQRWGGHIPIIPTTDVFLLLALLNELDDMATPPLPHGLAELLDLASRYPAQRAAALTGIPEAKIREIAEKIRQAPRTTFFASVGVNQGRFGTLSMVALQAIAYVTGNFDRQGGLLFQPFSRLLGWLTATKNQRSRVGGFTSNAGGMPCGILGDEILTPGDGQIRALIVVSGNPLTSAPDESKLRRAFESLDLLVSIDLFENETTEYADVILPGSTWLERADLAGWDVMHELEPMIQFSGRVRPTPGETRTESLWLAEVALAADRPFWGMRWLTRLWASLDLDSLSAGFLGLIAWLFQWMLKGAAAIPWPAPRENYYRRGAKFPRFWDELLADEPERLEGYAAALAEHQEDGSLLLMGRRRRLGQNSWIHDAGRTIEEREAVAWLHPKDMQRFSLEPSQLVEIKSQSGAIQIPVRAMETLMPGTIIVPHGLPGVNVNALISSAADYIEPMSGMHQMVGHRVKVRPARR